jgi:predicted transcriptional regulator
MTDDEELALDEIVEILLQIAQDEVAVLEGLLENDGPERELVLRNIINMNYVLFKKLVED